jgi:phosphoribosylformylglycinamidine synthase
LFNEELGAVVQIRKLDFDRLKNAVMEFAPELESLISVVGIVDPANHNIIELISNDTVFASYRRTELHRIWSETSYHMQSLRDNPECAKEEFDSLLDENDPGLSFSLTFDPNEKFGMTQEISVKPKVAILREQGVNGHAEMAYAFYRAGFDPVDVHMSDLFSGQADLSSFQGLAACGGFSYGDVLGAGSGWAKSILLHSSVKEQFQQFFHRPDTFSLGICNGCQMLSQLNSLIAKSDESPELHWPRFVKNKSERFESRVCMVEIIPGSAASKIWFNGMEGTRMPIVVSHGEGRTLYSKKSSDLDHLKSKNLPALRYIDNYGKPTEKFPRNPNGSEQGYTGFSSADGRILMMMPGMIECFL